MPTRVIKTSRDATLAIKTDNTLWQIQDKVLIRAYDSPAVWVKEGANFDRLQIDGDLVSSGRESTGLLNEGAYTSLTFGATSRVFAEIGLDSQGWGAKIMNFGEIDGINVGVGMLGGGSIVNFGEISGGTFGVLGGGKFPSGGGAEVEGIEVDNPQGGVISGNAAIYASGALTVANHPGATIFGGYAIRSEGPLTVGNGGKILSTGWAIIGSSFDDRVRSGGRIEGDIGLGGGNDLIDLHFCVFKGVAYGGEGNDIYVVSGAANLVEEIGQGVDTVKSYVSYTLADNFENLKLEGRVTINGTGNAEANKLTGNYRPNTLIGNAGADVLNGGRGADILTGGTDADIFHFSRFRGAGFGVDHITDFADGQDIIRIFRYKGFDDFGDLAGKIVQKGDDVWIDFGAGDRIVVEHMLASNLDANDIRFAI